MKGLLKPLRPNEIRRLRQAIQEQIVPSIYHIDTPSGQQPVFNGKIPHKQGESQLILPLRPIKIRGKNRAFVVKIPIHPSSERLLKGKPKSHRMLYVRFKVGNQECASLLLRNKGLDAPVHHSIGITRGLTGDVVQDLREFGVLKEADGFDFNTVPNGQKLEEKFKQQVALLKQMELQGQIVPERHREDPSKPYERTFLVACREGRKHAALIPGDLDNFYLTDHHPDAGHSAARAVQEGLFDEFMKAMNLRVGKKPSVRFSPLQ
ncbi:hypothetical protein HY994_03015 [Candidatus Micrarchaeota archaeon]|nr:hypothetical protein [Candidatus Micrarchaeota archaeon]